MTTAGCATDAPLVPASMDAAWLPRLLGRLDELKGRWPLLRRLPPERLAWHRRSTFLRNVSASSRQDGLATDEKLLSELLGREAGARALLSDQERLTAGLAVAWRRMPDHFRPAPGELTLDMLKRMHLSMFRYSTRSETTRGEFRWMPVADDLLDPYTRRFLELLPPGMRPGASPSTIPTLVEKATSSLNAAMKRGPLHPVPAAGLFIARLMAIQPFQDGNGRLCRMLLQALLLGAGYDQLLYHPLEELMEAHMDDLLRPLSEACVALRRADRPSSPEAADTEGDVEAGSSWFLALAALLDLHRESVETRMREEHQLQPLPELSEAIVRIAREHGRVTISGAGRITGANRNTLKVHFRRLVAQGLLELRGAGRGAWYEPGA